MIIERSMNDDWLSNTYLVADEEGGSALVIDAGGPCKPLLEAAERLGVYVRTLLLTHHHHDHVAEAFVWKEAEVLAHPVEAEQLEGVDRTIEPGDTLDVGGLHVETLHTPGHTAGTTVGEEWESNAFVRLWRGLDSEGDEQVKIWDQDATLVLWAPDYDGGHKAWVRWPDGSDDIVPGSQVVRD